MHKLCLLLLGQGRHGGTPMQFLARPVFLELGDQGLVPELCSFFATLKLFIERSQDLLQYCGPIAELLVTLPLAPSGQHSVFSFQL